MTASVQNSYDKLVIGASSINDILPDHKEHLNWLRTTFGDNAVKSYTDGLEEYIESVEVGSTMFIPMKQIGGIRISLFTYSSNILPKPSDPISLVFKSNAKTDNVVDYLQNKIFPPWLDTGIGCASPQWIRLENPANSGKLQWVKMSSSRAIGGCALIRNHMRFFDAGYDSSPDGVGNCCIGGVHYEEWEVPKLNHVIKDWNKSREFMEKLFADLPTTKTSSMIMQQPSSIQNVPYDGYASVIQLA